MQEPTVAIPIQLLIPWRAVGFYVRDGGRVSDQLRWCPRRRDRFCTCQETSGGMPEQLETFVYRAGTRQRTLPLDTAATLDLRPIALRSAHMRGRLRASSGSRCTFITLWRRRPMSSVEAFRTSSPLGDAWILNHIAQRNGSPTPKALPPEISDGEQQGRAQPGAHRSMSSAEVR